MSLFGILAFLFLKKVLGFTTFRTLYICMLFKNINEGARSCHSTRSSVRKYRIILTVLLISCSVQPFCICNNNTKTLFIFTKSFTTFLARCLTELRMSFFLFIYILFSPFAYSQFCLTLFMKMCNLHAPTSSELG